MILNAPWMPVLVTVLGLVMGSAVTAIAHRVPRGLSWVRGRSACPSCGHVLTVIDLVPVLSWASTGGRCRYCRVRVPWRYPLTELACGTWALLLCGLGAVAAFGRGAHRRASMSASSDTPAPRKGATAEAGTPMFEPSRRSSRDS